MIEFILILLLILLLLLWIGTYLSLLVTKTLLSTLSPSTQIDYDTKKKQKKIIDVVYYNSLLW